MPHFSGAAPGLSLNGEAATGTLGMDYERGRLLTWFALTPRIAAWMLAGTGWGGLTLEVDDEAAQRHRTDLSMTLAAVGMRGDLLIPTEAGGFALAVTRAGRGC